jgi:hypothetical protein
MTSAETAMRNALEVLEGFPLDCARDSLDHATRCYDEEYKPHLLKAAQANLNDVEGAILALKESLK